MDIPNTNRCAGVLRSAMEVIVLAMTVLAPWAFGAVHPASILGLYLGLSAALLLWTATVVLERGAVPVRCPIFWCLGGMVALGVWQLLPFDHASMSVLSSNTAALRSDLYPAELESLIGEDSVAPAAETITFDPHATRGRLVQLLGLLALFAVVRFAIASPASWRRFAIACTINGALLSIVALAQRYSSPPNVIYWSYPSLGAAYGPFVCRNNFADYANICLFLGVGLLIGTPGFQRQSGGFRAWFAELGSNPWVPWLAAAVGLTVAGTVYSMSRGGVVAMAGGALAFLGLSIRAKKLGAGASALAPALLLALGAALWFGVDAVGDRLGTLSEDPNRERRKLWERTLPLAARFPLWGTGYGTFETVEPSTRHPGDAAAITWENAHNDYLETLVEGGAVQLGLLLGAIGFAFRSGFRVLDRPEAALASGGLAGLTAVALHSFGDFGLHIPAVAVLATVMAAHLSALGDSSGVTSPSRSRTLAAAVACACILTAIVLPVDGWFRERAEHYRLAAVRAENRLPPGERDVVIRYLRAASAYAPDDAAIRLRLAEVEYGEYQTRRGRAPVSTSMQADLDEALARPALRDYLRLRAVNPLYAQAHARLAGNRQYLEHADTVRHYLDRATRLRPTEEGLWYASGLDHLSSGDADRGWQDWRNALRCSPAHLSNVAPVALARLGPAGAVDSVFPPNAILLYQAARTAPLDARAADRRRFAARAVERLEPIAPGGADDAHARAWLLNEAGRANEALVEYEAALRGSPPPEWRMEYATLLFAKRDYAEAERQVRQVLQEKPDLDGIRAMNAALVRARAGVHTE